MIRPAEPHDQPDLDRLAIAQFCRTPWHQRGAFAQATDFHVCERAGRVVGCVGFQRSLTGIFVVHAWVEDGFSGRRAGVELLKDLRNLADAEGIDLTFTASPGNHGLREAVEKYGCEGECADRNAVFYRRKAKGSVWADQA